MAVSKVEQLAQQLGVGHKAASKFARDIEVELGRSVTYLELITLLDQKASEPTVDSLVRVLREQDTERALCADLHISEQQIRDLIESITLKTGFRPTLDVLKAARSFIRSTSTMRQDLTRYVTLHKHCAACRISSVAELLDALDTLQPPGQREEAEYIFQNSTIDTPSLSEVLLHIELERLRKLRPSISLNAHVMRLQLQKEIPWATADQLLLSVQTVRHHRGDFPDIKDHVTLRALLQNSPILEPYTLIEHIPKHVRGSKPSLSLQWFIRIVQAIHNPIKHQADIYAYLNIFEWLKSYFWLSEQAAHDALQLLQKHLPAPVSLTQIQGLVGQAIGAEDPKKRAKMTTKQVVDVLVQQYRNEDHLRHLEAILNKPRPDINRLIRNIIGQLTFPVSLGDVRHAIDSIPSKEEFSLEGIVHVAQGMLKRRHLETLIAPYPLDPFLATVQLELGDLATVEDLIVAARAARLHPEHLLDEEVIAYCRIAAYCRSNVLLPEKPELLLREVRSVVPEMSYANLKTYVNTKASTKGIIVTLRKQREQHTERMRLATALALAETEVDGFLRAVQEHRKTPTTPDAIIQAVRALKKPYLPAEAAAYLDLGEILRHGAADDKEPQRFLERLQENGSTAPQTYTEAVTFLAHVPVRPIRTESIQRYLLLTAEFPFVAGLLREKGHARPFEHIEAMLRAFTDPKQVRRDDLVSLLDIVPPALHSRLYFSAGATQWMCAAALRTFLASRLQRLQGSTADLDAYAATCWADIQSAKRRYPIPSLGRAELRVSQSLTELTGIKALQFFQEGTTAPGVCIRVHFAGPGNAHGWLGITQMGAVRGFPDLVGHPPLKTVVRSVALAYYRDFVCPAIQYAKLGSGTIKIVRNTDTISIPSEPAVGVSAGERNAQHSPRVRNLPRTVRQYTDTSRAIDFDEWYIAQFRAAHQVTGHPRFVGQGYIADREKMQQAERAGIKLEEGYTWVVEHHRSGSTTERIPIVDSDLTEHVVFAPPISATRELEHLLYANGMLNG